jgi:hypothetical protein
MQRADGGSFCGGKMDEVSARAEWYMSALIAAFNFGDDPFPRLAVFGKRTSTLPSR